MLRVQRCGNSSKTHVYSRGEEGRSGKEKNILKNEWACNVGFVAGLESAKVTKDFA